MSLEENKAIVRRWIEEINKGNLGILDELVAPDFFHPTHQLRGPEGIKQFYTMFLNVFSDIHETVKDIIAEGDKVWHYFECTGTHTGEYRGLAPTGKKVAWTGVNFWRIVDGKVVEKASVYDMLDLYKQLGVIEYKGFPDEVK